jgi:hypothetical protein
MAFNLGGLYSNEGSPIPLFGDNESRRKKLNGLAENKSIYYRYSTRTTGYEKSSANTYYYINEQISADSTDTPGSLGSTPSWGASNRMGICPMFNL